MSEHSPEPWQLIEQYLRRDLSEYLRHHDVHDAERNLVATVYGGTPKEREANRALILAAPAMERKLREVRALLNGDSYTLGLRRHSQADNISTLLATAEPAEPPTLLDACKAALVDGESQGYTPTALLTMLRDAVAAEEARINADA